MEGTKRIVVIGGSAAGPKAAAKAWRTDPTALITLIQQEAEFSMASCGYPYYVGGEVAARDSLIGAPTGGTRDAAYFRKVKGIEALPHTRAIRIDRTGRRVFCTDLDTGKEMERRYDKLIIATGARAFVPPLPGKDLEGVTTLHTLGDADYLRTLRDAKKVNHAVVIGGGLIGVEAAEALCHSGIEVTIVELLPNILSFLDPELAMIVQNHVAAHARILTSSKVEEFIGRDGKLAAVRLGNGESIACDLAVVAIGVRPNSDLAAEAGLQTGKSGGILVNEYMQTSDPDIYAAGDCVEVPHRVSGQRVSAPFGDLANLEGRVAGQNAAGDNRETFCGTVLTGVCRAFNYSAGSTGLSESRAGVAGFDNTTSVLITGFDRPGFMGAQFLLIKMLADNATGRVLGVQCVGPGDVSKRIAIAATAIQAGFTVADFINLDLPYAPPFSPALDPVIVVAHVLENKMRGRMDGIKAPDLQNRLKASGKMTILDVRQPQEFGEMKLGLGEMAIPLGELRDRLGELPENRDHEIVCCCKSALRAFEAANILRAAGWKNVKVLEGGLMAWPYRTE